MTDDWSWKPDTKELPKFKPKTGKLSKNRKKKKKKRVVVSKESNAKFYSSREWRELRYRVLEMYEGQCMACGRNPRDHNVVLNVDHIKPRKKYPHLALDINNLQILCGACNCGKGNKFETDWRPKEKYFEEMLDDDQLEDGRGIYF